MAVKLRWEPFSDRSEMAYLGKVSIGMVGYLDDDPTTWWYKVDGIHVKWIATGFGHVKGKAAAKRGVERAFKAWAERAELL